jgi:hypothetical protein
MAQGPESHAISSTTNNAAVSRKRFAPGEFLRVGDVVD